MTASKAAPKSERSKVLVAALKYQNWCCPSWSASLTSFWYKTSLTNVVNVALVSESIFKE